MKMNKSKSKISIYSFGNQTNKRGLEMSFAWLFAIIVGAFILFLAIYFSVKFIKTEQDISDVKAGKEIGTLLNPLETSFETSTTTFLTMPVESRIYNKCDNTGNFGQQIIQVSQKTLNKWSKTDMDVEFYNKYLFSEEYVEGKKFYIFSKPFEFPFKVSDLIYITSSEENYCFINAPDEIKEELELLNQGNLHTENCHDDSIEVCFRGTCEIEVNYNMEYVEKGSDRMYFKTDALMYAAIFSDSGVYECQLKRLMQRTKQLASIYNEKAIFISRAGCDSNLNLLELSNLADNLEDSSDLFPMAGIVEDIQEKNEIADCSLW